MKIKKYSHHFVVTDISPEERAGIRRFLIPLLQTERVTSWNGETTSKISRVFAASDALRMYYRFSNNLLEQFYLHMDRYLGYKIDRKIEIEPMYTPAAVEIAMNPLFVPKPGKQVPIIDYLLDDDGVVNKMVQLQPGGGKTFMSLWVASVMGQRTMIGVKPKYVGGWLEAIYGKKCVTQCTADDVIEIQGTQALAQLIRMGLAGEITAKIIIVSNSTLAAFIKDYEKAPEVCVAKYGASPLDLCRVLGIGLFIRDEVHIDFHMFFKIDMYTHVPKTISLSGTYDSDGQFIGRMQEMIHPKGTRAPEIPYNKYVRVVAISYKLKSRNLKWNLRGRTEYNHAALELSIMANAYELQQWLELIGTVMDYEFVRDKRENERSITMCATVNMCDKVIQKYQTMWPELTIVRYCQGDPYEDILVSDMIVTTVKTGHASIDVPGLKTGLLTANVGSKEINEQAMNRTRENPNFEPRYVYLFTEDIGAAAKYHSNKKIYFSGKALSFATKSSGVTIKDSR